MAATSIKRARVAAGRAYESAMSAAEVCAITGDRKGEIAYLHAARSAKARKESLERERTGGQELALRVVRDRRSRSIHRQRRDALAEMAAADPPAISAAQFRAGIVLREHVEAANVGAVQVVERVDGGFIGNGQMEALCDRRRPVRYALNAAMDAVADRDVLAGAMAVVIYGKSLREACRVACISEGGKGSARIRDAISEALDAAVAHLGIAS